MAQMAAKRSKFQEIHEAELKDSALTNTATGMRASPSMTSANSGGLLAGVSGVMSPLIKAVKGPVIPLSALSHLQQQYGLRLMDSSGEDIQDAAQLAHEECVVCRSAGHGHHHSTTAAAAAAAQPAADTDWETSDSDAGDAWNGPRRSPARVRPPGSGAASQVASPAAERKVAGPGGASDSSGGAARKDKEHAERGTGPLGYVCWMQRSAVLKLVDLPPSEAFVKRGSQALLDTARHGSSASTGSDSAMSSSSSSSSSAAAAAADSTQTKRGRKSKSPSRAGRGDQNPAQQTSAAGAQHTRRPVDEKKIQRWMESKSAITTPEEDPTVDLANLHSSDGYFRQGVFLRFCGHAMHFMCMDVYIG